MKKVQEIIVEELGKEPSEVTLESTFEDLEADSLDCSKLSLKLKMLLTSKSKLKKELSTVGDLVAYVEEKTK